MRPRGGVAAAGACSLGRAVQRIGHLGVWSRRGIGEVPCPAVGVGVGVEHRRQRPLDFVAPLRRRATVDRRPHQGMDKRNDRQRLSINAQQTARFCLIEGLIKALASTPSARAARSTPSSWPLSCAAATSRIVWASGDNSAARCR